MKKCKRCNGTGKVLENHKGDSGTINFYGIQMKVGKKNSSKGTVCPRCHGKGQV